MAFLDNLVSDLIRKSTGFNARPFVRRVGARNILLLGGAAIAGALAAEKMRAPATTSPVPPVPDVPDLPPPLPPLPPPPIPVEAAEDEIPKELLFAIVRTMVAGALSDGEVHSDEKKLIESRLSESPLSPAQVSQIHKDLVIPPSPAEILQAVPDAEDRELLYRFALLVVRADADASEKESAWLDKLAAAAGIQAERRTAIESELFSAR